MKKDNKLTLLLITTPAPFLVYEVLNTFVSHLLFCCFLPTRLTSSTVMGCVRYRAPFCLRLSGGPSAGPAPSLPGRDSLLKRASFSLMLSLQLSSPSSSDSACTDWTSTGGAGLGVLMRNMTPKVREEFMFSQNLLCLTHLIYTAVQKQWRKRWVFIHYHEHTQVIFSQSDRHRPAAATPYNSKCVTENSP